MADCKGGGKAIGFDLEEERLHFLKLKTERADWMSGWLYISVCSGWELKREYS